MSRAYGKNWQPCLRQNGKVMMRVNPEVGELILNQAIKPKPTLLNWGVAE